MLCMSPVCSLRQTYPQQSTVVPGLWVVAFGKEEKNETMISLKITLLECKQMGEAKVPRWVLLEVMLCLYNLSLTTCFIYMLTSSI